MKTVKIIFVAATIVYFPSNVNAQIKTSPYEVGINVGTALYAGDLTPTFFSPYKTPSFILGITGSKNLNNVLAVRVQLAFGKVRADDANYKTPAFRQQRNFNFKTPITEFSAAFVVMPLGRERIFTPYFSAGAGISFLKVKRDYSNLNEDYFSNDPAITEGLPQDITHKLPKVIPVLPVGAGIRYSLNKKLSLNLETSYRLMSNDYLDGFSKAANPDKKDHYYTHTIGLLYSFGQKNMLDCPTK